MQKQIVLCRQMLIDYPRNFIILSDLASALIACYEGLEDLHKVALDNHYLEEGVKLSEMLYYRMTAQGTFDALKEHPDFEVLLEQVTSYIKK